MDTAKAAIARATTAMLSASLGSSESSNRGGPLILKAKNLKPFKPKTLIPEHFWVKHAVCNSQLAELLETPMEKIGVIANSPIMLLMEMSMRVVGKPWEMFALNSVFVSTTRMTMTSGAKIRLGA